MDEQELIRRSQAGETAAIEGLLGCYEGLIYNLAHRYFGSQAEAADAAQEAMVKIYRRIGEFKGHSAFKTWVYRVTTNVCLDTLRKHRIEPLSLDDSDEDGRPTLQVPSGGVDPENALEQEELREILTQLLTTLAEDHRVILVLRDLEGLAYEEIAGILGCSLGTVKSRLARAREALRRRFLASPRTTGWIEGRLRA